MFPFRVVGGTIAARTKNAIVSRNPHSNLTVLSFFLLSGDIEMRFMVELLHKERTTMAKPVKETPILFGEEARKFEMKMLHPKPLPPKKVKNIKRDYDFLRKKCVNCSF